MSIKTTRINSSIISIDGFGHTQLSSDSNDIYISFLKHTIKMTESQLHQAIKLFIATQYELKYTKGLQNDTGKNNNSD